MLRSSLLLTLSLSLSLSAIGMIACTGSAIGDLGSDDRGSTPSSPEGSSAQCAPPSANVCTTVLGTASDEPSRDGSLVWAQLAVTPESWVLGADYPKLAVYEDGLVRRTPVVRNVAYGFTPPRGLVVASLSASSMAKLRTDIAAVSDDDKQAFLKPQEHPSATDQTMDIIGIGSGTACGRPAGRASYPTCMPAALSQLDLDLAALDTAIAAKWRAAQAGTVSLGAEMTVAGDWPLADARATDGGATFSAAEWRMVTAVGSQGLYRLSGGDYVQVNFATTGENGNADVYLTRMSSVTIGDDQAPLRTELLSSVERYSSSKGKWLGVELAADRFPAFKNRELAMVPASGSTPAKLYYLYAIEHLDLRADGELTLP